MLGHGDDLLQSGRQQRRHHRHGHHRQPPGGFRVHPLRSAQPHQGQALQAAGLPHQGKQRGNKPAQHDREAEKQRTESG